MANFALKTSSVSPKSLHSFHKLICRNREHSQSCASNSLWKYHRPEVGIHMDVRNRCCWLRVSTLCSFSEFFLHYSQNDILGHKGKIIISHHQNMLQKCPTYFLIQEKTFLVNLAFLPRVHGAGPKSYYVAVETLYFFCSPHAPSAPKWPKL